jgi:hypothetical protein
LSQFEQGSSTVKVTLSLAASLDLNALQDLPL